MFKFTRRALIDLDNIYDYTVTQWSIGQADRYLNDLYRLFETIANHPPIGQFEPARDGYRRFPFKSHIIYYTIQTKHITIQRILHNKRDKKVVFAKQ